LTGDELLTKPGIMNKKQSREFESKLLEKRRGITANRSSMGAENDSNPEYGRDEGDRANASQAKEMTWLRTSQERGLLELIDAALSRINDGTFGECEHCGQEIGIKRLSAIPWTRYCIACQELLEQYGS
jgi:DnaK suppressor protein